MQVDQIRDVMTAQPFCPFALRLADGTTYVVKHPDYVAIPPARRPRHIIYWTPRNGDPEDYRAHWLDVGLVMELIVPWDIAQPAAAQSEI